MTEEKQNIEGPIQNNINSSGSINPVISQNQDNKSFSNSTQTVQNQIIPQVQIQETKATNLAQPTPTQTLNPQTEDQSQNKNPQQFSQTQKPTPAQTIPQGQPTTPNQSPTQVPQTQPITPAQNAPQAPQAQQPTLVQPIPQAPQAQPTTPAQNAPQAPQAQPTIIPSSPQTPTPLTQNFPQQLYPPVHPELHVDPLSELIPTKQNTTPKLIILLVITILTIAIIIIGYPYARDGFSKSVEKIEKNEDQKTQHELIIEKPDNLKSSIESEEKSLKEENKTEDLKPNEVRAVIEESPLEESVNTETTNESSEASSSETSSTEEKAPTTTEEKTRRIR